MSESLTPSPPADLPRRVGEMYRGLHPSQAHYAWWKVKLDPIFKNVFAAVPDGKVILDAGCGPGLMSNGLAMQSPANRVIGVDLDERKLAAAKHAARSLPNAQYLAADLLTYEFPPADVVLMIDILHYWQPAKQQHLIAKAAGCLPAGGLLIFREGLDSPSIGHRVVHTFERFAVLLGHNPRGDGLNFQSADFYRRAFEGAGMELTQSAADWGRGSNTVLIWRKR